MNYFRYAIRTMGIYLIVVYAIIAGLGGAEGPLWYIGDWDNSMIMALLIIPILLTFLHILFKLISGKWE